MGETTMGNAHSQRAADAANCPALTGNAIQRARRADGDAADFAMLVRDEPPEVVWGRVARWAEQHPQRFAAAFVHLAAMVDVDAPPAVWAREMGGTATLHPDFNAAKPEPRVPPAERTPDLEDKIVTLARDAQMSDVQIATRFGLPIHYVVKVRRAAGLVLRPATFSAGKRDAEIARLTKLNYSISQIAREVGVNPRTVMRSRQRTRERAERAAPASDASAA